jgi:prepilin-type N-terminal cleavage/methylation domain-containing protein
MAATIIANNTDRSGDAAPHFGVQSGCTGRFSRAFAPAQGAASPHWHFNYGNYAKRGGCSLSRRLQMTKKHSDVSIDSESMSGEKMGKHIELSGQNVVRRACGFTLIEIIVVVVILSIIALMAVPMFGSAADIQLKAAANMIAADLEYAKSMAITRQQPFSIDFNSTDESYSVCDSGGFVIPHPIDPGDLTITFPSDSRLNQVVIVSAVFDPGSEDTITFDYLGSPHSGSLAGNPLDSGVVTLEAGGLTMTVSVEPITGYITIDN